MPLLIVN